MSTRKAASVKVGTKTSGEHVPTPWDIVNVFGYALGVDRNTLDYTSRKESRYNFDYCSSRKALRDLRAACAMRRALMENYDKLQDILDRDGRLCLPARLFSGVPKKMASAMRSSSSVEDALCKVQFYITNLLPSFEKELPCSVVLAAMVSSRFSLGWAQSGKSVRDWCVDTIDALAGAIYFYQWDNFSERFLRDDRDLVEELFLFYGRDPTEYRLPYAHNKSNKRVHIERLQEFCTAHADVLVELDTENIEVLPTIAFLKALEKYVPGLIKYIHVYTDENTSKMWEHLSEFVSIPITVKGLQRIRSRKSVMDTAIIASVMEARYTNSAAGVLVVSSDSDFLMLSQQLPDFPICYCCSHKAVSPSAQSYLREHKLPTVYIDYVVNICDVKQAEQECIEAHLIAVLQQKLPNIKTVFASAVRDLGHAPNKEACEDFICRSIKGLTLSVSEDGTIDVSINEESVE